MERILRYEICNQNTVYIGKPIDFFLKSMGFSSRNLIALKKIPEGICVNDVWVHVNYKLQAGDRLSIHLIETESSAKIEPVPLPFPIVYEDEDLLVLNKPADMPIHPSLHNYTNSLANAAAYYFQEQHIPYVFRCVNRLDRDTTGLTILARHQISSGILSTQVANREIHREYLAIVSGIITSPSGTVDAPIGRVPGSTIERTIDYDHGERAVTHYTLVRTCPEKNLSLLSLSLETGRTHQIRVHMKSLGHPLIGDYIYNPDYRYIKRQALHSFRLSFRHPISGVPLSFTAPLPDDMMLF